MGLGGVSPWAFRHRSLLKTRLGSSPMPQLPVLPCRTFSAPRKQNSCRWQYKKAPLEPQRYPLPGERLRSHPLAYCPPGRVWCVGLSWHTSSVGVPGYSWYCLSGSGALCVASCLVRRLVISPVSVCTPVPGGQSHHKYPTCTLVPGRHYQIVTGGNALGYR